MYILNAFVLIAIAVIAPSVCWLAIAWVRGGHATKGDFDISEVKN